MKNTLLGFIAVIFGCMVHAQSIPCYLPDTGLIAWFPFNGNANDESGNGHYGVVGVNTPLTSDRYGASNSAYHFNGINSNVITHDSCFNIGMHNFTISGWTYLDSINNPHNWNNNQEFVNTIPHNGIGIGFNWGRTGKYGLWSNHNPPSASWSILGNAASRTSGATRVWRHLVLRKVNDTGYHFFINGRLDTSYRVTRAANNINCKLSIGRTDSTRAMETFLGTLDDVGLWSRALTDSEIADVYFAIDCHSVCAGGTDTFSSFVTGGTWSCSPTSVATINASTGVVYGITAGSAIVTYTLGGIAGHAQVNIVSTGTLSSIAGIFSLCLGDTTTLSDSTPGGTWSTAAPGIASVDTSGLVRGTGVGTAHIFYTLAGTGCNVSVPITITAAPRVSAISGPSSICTGSMATFTDSISGGTWRSSHTSIATVSTIGIVYGLSAGTDTIIYIVSGACGTASATRVIMVNTLPVPGTITGSATVCLGASTALRSSVSGGSWTTSFPSVATVSTSGVVFGISSGVDTIGYTVSNMCGSSSVYFIINVITPLHAGPVSGFSQVCVGDSIALTGLPAGGSWGTSRTAISTISSTGQVTGISLGSSLMTYTVANACGRSTDTFRVTVVGLPIAGVIAGPSAAVVGTPISLTSSGAFGGTWSSSDTGIATVNVSGAVSGRSSGMVTITYTVTNSCGTVATTKQIKVSGALTLPASESIVGSIYIYPNPTSSMVYIDAPIKVNVIVLTAVGQTVMNVESTNKVDLSALPSGVYLVRINGTYVVRVVKE